MNEGFLRRGGHVKCGSTTRRESGSNYEACLLYFEALGDILNWEKGEEPR